MTKEQKLKESGPTLVSPKAKMNIAASVVSKSEWEKSSKKQNKTKSTSEN
ncbi:MAG: hypothetical protein LPH21_06350 [Shewanella sp.]|nr:hypothetical protein [Shewanella sp.]